MVTDRRREQKHALTNCGPNRTGKLIDRGQGTVTLIKQSWSHVRLNFRYGGGNYRVHLNRAVSCHIEFSGWTGECLTACCHSSHPYKRSLRRTDVVFHLLDQRVNVFTRQEFRGCSAWKYVSFRSIKPARPAPRRSIVDGSGTS